MGFDSEKSFVMAERLKQLREEKGLSHEKLSKTLFDQYGVKISSDSLMNYEVADKNHTKAYKNQGMRVEYLRCLCDFFKVSTDYLLGISNVRSIDADIKMVSEITGLTEKNAAVLCNARRLNKLLDDPLLQKNEIIRNLGNDLAKKLSVQDRIEPGDEFGFIARLISTWGSNAYIFVNDLLDAYTSNFILMDSYTSMLQLGTKSINLDGIEAEDFNKASSIISSSRFIVLDPSEYVYFKSGEISKAIDFFLTGKYGHDDEIS